MINPKNGYIHLKIKWEVVYNETILIYHILNYRNHAILDQFFSQEGDSQGKCSLKQLDLVEKRHARFVYISYLFSAHKGTVVL